MKITVMQENLQKGLGHVARAVAGKTSLPVLGNILLATDQGQLKLAATNLEIGITNWVDCQVEEEGAVTVPARLLTDFVGNLPNDMVKLELDRRTLALHVRAARSKATIKGIDAEDFPAIPTVEGEPTAVIAADLFREMIAQVVFAAAADESRPVLAGVHLKFEGDQLTLSAADGFRMAVRQGALSQPVKEDLAIIVPARAMNELSRAIGDQQEAVELTVTRNRSQLLCRVGGLEFLSRLIDGNFPDWRQIVPSGYETRSVLQREQFLGAARLASYFARDNNDVIKLTVKPGEGEYATGCVTISANAAEVGDNTSDLDAAVEGPEGQIAFNVRYVSDVLSALKTPQVALEMQGPQNAGVIRPVGAGDDYTHVIMPMHLASY
ncbi:MAG TPA: DNA polymerase III subunit beta [Thermomicrobiales bacterium]|nr:DNA polymerase III subunit beta [Thermomicrobiales bacterium]